MRGKEMELQSAQKSSCYGNNRNQQSNVEESQRKNNHKRKNFFSYGFYKREEVSVRNILWVFLYFTI